jgi:hypothetical protein
MDEEQTPRSARRPPDLSVQMRRRLLGGRDRAEPGHGLCERVRRVTPSVDIVAPDTSYNEPSQILALER